MTPQQQEEHDALSAILEYRLATAQKDLSAASDTGVVAICVDTQNPGFEKMVFWKSWGTAVQKVALRQMAEVTDNHGDGKTLEAIREATMELGEHVESLWIFMATDIGEEAIETTGHFTGNRMTALGLAQIWRESFDKNFSKDVVETP